MFKQLYRRLAIIPIFLLSGCATEAIRTQFHSEVCLKPYHGYEYTTCKNIYFSVNDELFVIPKGFKTDLASIPRIGWSFIGPAHSKLIRPAVVHDWFYNKTCDFDRYQIDNIFYYMLLNDGVSKFKANLMYYSVRAFGWPYYNEDYCE